MKLFFNSLKHQNNTINFGTEIQVFISEHHRSGGYLVGPSSIEYNGNYYGTGQKLLPEEEGIIWKFNPLTEIFTNAEIYGAASSSETIQHRYPSILFDGDGHIIIAATDPHNTTVRIYKSDNPEDITGFTVIKSIVSNTSYPCLSWNTFNELIIWHRDIGTGSGADRYVGSIYKLNMTTLNFTTLKLIQSASTGDSDRRIYTTHPKQKVNNTWEYLVCNQRMGNAGTEEYNEQFVLKTMDFNTFHNLEETYSKNVDSLGIITEAERVNFSVADDIPLKGVGLINASIVNDIYVSYYYDWDAGIHYLQWFDGSWHTKDIQFLDIPYGDDGGVNSMYKLGNFYYISIRDNATNHEFVYKSSIPFNSFEKVHDYSEITGLGRSNVIFPVNIADEQKTIALGIRFLESIIYNVVTFE